MNPLSYQQQTRDLIDGLKAVCANNGLGNDGNEYKIIVQTFLYKLLCDQFAHEMKLIEPKFAAAPGWIAAWQALPAAKRRDLEDELPADAPRLSAQKDRGPEVHSYGRLGPTRLIPGNVVCAQCA